MTERQKILANILKVDEADLEASRRALDELSDCPDPWTIEGAIDIMNLNGFLNGNGGRNGNGGNEE